MDRKQEDAAYEDWLKRRGTTTGLSVFTVMGTLYGPTQCKTLSQARAIVRRDPRAYIVRNADKRRVD